MAEAEPAPAPEPPPVAPPQATKISEVPWDPLLFDATRAPSKTCLARVQRDVRQIMKDPLPGIFVVFDDTKATSVHALVSGNADTPYEGGMFYFLVDCPDDYPTSPPRVRFMTTGGAAVSFNPNLYANGKVCLSILGTWHGPSWSSVHSVASVLLSIQSLLNEKPYHNEPGFSTEKFPFQVESYNDIIRHETLRVAVLGMVKNQEQLPEAFKLIIRDLFLAFEDFYQTVCDENHDKDGRQFQCPFNLNRGIFKYRELRKELQQLSNELSG